MNKPTNNSSNQNKDHLQEELAPKLSFLNVEQERGGNETPASLPHSHKEDFPQDPFIEQHAHSATQSFLHDSYYPHLYYQDWHEAEYDETDRLQDYYRDEAYDTSNRFYEESYHNQAEQRQTAYHENHYEVSFPWAQSAFFHSDRPYASESDYPHSEPISTGSLATGETPLQQVFPVTTSYIPANLPSNDYFNQSEFDNRLTVNHGDDYSAIAPQDYVALLSPSAGVIIAETSPTPVAGEALNSSQLTNIDANQPDFNRLTVNHESYLNAANTSVAAASVISPSSHGSDTNLFTSSPEDNYERLIVNQEYGSEPVLSQDYSTTLNAGIPPIENSLCMATPDIHQSDIYTNASYYSSTLDSAHHASYAEEVSSRLTVNHTSNYGSAISQSYAPLLASANLSLTASNQQTPVLDSSSNSFVTGSFALHEDGRLMINRDDCSITATAVASAAPVVVSTYIHESDQGSPASLVEDSATRLIVNHVSNYDSATYTEQASVPEAKAETLFLENYQSASFLSNPDTGLLADNSDLVEYGRLTVNHTTSQNDGIFQESTFLPETKTGAPLASEARHTSVLENYSNMSLADPTNLSSGNGLIVNRDDVTHAILPAETLSSSVLGSSVQGINENKPATLLADNRLTVNQDHDGGLSHSQSPRTLPGMKTKTLNSETGIADSILTSPKDDLLSDPLRPSTIGKAEEQVSLAGVATLDALGIAGGVAANIGVAVGGIAMQTASSAAREDELVGKIDEGREIVFNAVSKEMGKGRSSLDGGLLKKIPTEKLIKESAVGKTLTRENSSPVNAEQLAEKLQKEKALDEKDLGLIGEEEKGAPPEGKGKDKKPATKRERDLLEKKKLLKEANPDVGKAAALVSPAKKVGDSLSKGANITKNIAVSSASSVIAKENEDVATLMSMKNVGKKGVNTTKNLARLPQKVAQRAQQATQFIKTAWAATSHAVSAIATAGWPAILAVAGILLLVVVGVVAIVGSLVILNEKQEISEVAALVAELDEQLEEEIHTYGQSGTVSSSPIYYLDARGTYDTTDEYNEDLTLNADLEDDVSDLQLVDASSVSVYTNPDGIIAYIDAKYSGEWQAGAASWKITVNWDDKTYNIFDWENVPEWVQSGLNKLERETFRGNIQELVRDYLMEEVLPEEDYGPRDLETRIVENIAEDVADELANVIYDQQLQNVSDEVIYEAVRAAVQEHGDDLIQITDEHLQEMNYQLMEEFTSIVGEQEPVALVYDEIVELHGLLNYWSEDYEHISATSTFGGSSTSGISGTLNAYGYPNASGYNADELTKWDGYNEVSVYGISESGTTSITGDGTRITNNWSDTTMAIACEGLQNEYFAYWTSAYKKLHPNSNQPVRITLYNPETGKTVTVEVRDCGGWRGFNSRYAGMNATRQWDLLPAVWLALGGTQSSGLMNVYWRVDNEAPLTGIAGAAADVTIEDYPWEKETDNADGEITVNRATYIRHDIQDLMHNDSHIEKLIGRDNFASDAEFKAVINFVVMKLKDIMEPVLTAENVLGELYTDYFMTRRELGNPFGTATDGSPTQWIVTKRFNPGYEDKFDKEEVSASIKPLNGDLSVYAVKEGTILEVGEDSVTVSTAIDGDVDERIIYSNLSNILVSEGDEINEGTKLGKLVSTDESLELSWYEVFTYIGDWDRQRGWAYCPTLFMAGFAGYEEPKKPTEYSGGSLRNLADCETIVDYAYSRLGCPYVWGATGPYVFDCSGLTQWCYAQAGIYIPRNSEQQYAAALLAGNTLPLDESLLQPGDILWKQGHVGIYIGNNQYIHAPHTGDVVKVSSGISLFTCALRFL